MKYMINKFTRSIFGCGSCAILAVIKTSLITFDHHVFMIRAESAMEVLLHLCFIMLRHPLRLPHVSESRQAL